MTSFLLASGVILRVSDSMRSSSGLLEVAEAEEEVLFSDGFGGAPVGAEGAGGAVDEHLFADAVLPGIGREVDVSLVVEGLKELLDAQLMARVGRGG